MGSAAVAIEANGGPVVPPLRGGGVWGGGVCSRPAALLRIYRFLGLLRQSGGFELPSREAAPPAPNPPGRGGNSVIPKITLGVRIPDGKTERTGWEEQVAVGRGLQAAGTPGPALQPGLFGYLGGLL